MQFTTVSTLVPLQSQPNTTSPPVEYPAGYPYAIQKGEPLIDVSAEGDGSWSKVTVDRGGGQGPTGYIISEMITVTDLAHAAVSLADFTHYCAAAAVAFDVDLPYLLAVARVESGKDWDDINGLINGDVFSTSDSGPIGPFQFQVSTWLGVTKQIPPGFGYTLEDIVSPQAQANGAAFLADDGIKRHEAKFGGIPSPAELYVYHFLGAGAAIAVLGDQAQRVDQFVSEVAIRNNGSILGTVGDANTGEKVLTIIANRLHDAYQQNAPLFKDAPDWWPLPAAGAAAPWLNVAQQEIGQEEASPPNPRISGYLEAVGFPPGTANSVSWCAAFVCWCLKNSGDAAAVATVAKYHSSFAKDWLDLPVQLLEPRVGAIAVKRAQSKDVTGHAGFVNAIEADGSISLLAGNQGGSQNGGKDRVCIINFPRESFLGFRWVGESVPTAVLYGRRLR